MEKPNPDWDFIGSEGFSLWRALFFFVTKLATKGNFNLRVHHVMIRKDILKIRFLVKTSDNKSLSP